MKKILIALFLLFTLPLAACSTLESVGDKIKKNPIASAVLFQEGIYQLIGIEQASKRVLLARQVVSEIDSVIAWYQAFTDSETVTPDLIDQFIIDNYSQRELRPSQQMLIELVSTELKRIAVDSAGTGAIPEDSVYTLHFLLSNAKKGASFYL